VLPTMTYTAESDDRLSQLKLAVGTPIATGSTPHGDVGGSTGDTHPDGTGVIFASRRRPMKEFRSDVSSAFLPGPGTFAIDLDLLRFLHHSGIGFDVITDDDLHRDGVAALAPYRATLTGSRPVYATAAMLAAYDGYLADGGRMICFGGGGFYWVTSPDTADGAVIEVRRGENGMRAWQIGPGELYHATTGERGGLWRGRGRPPQRLLGVGYAARGFGPGTAYKRMPDSYHKAVSWIFDGVEGNVFGERSRLPGGAAGLEIDRYDRTLGSPPHARILATSFRLSDDYHQAIEETLFTLAGRGGRENEHVRADMVFFTTPHDGAVFTAGSAAWCAALAVDGFDNATARISANVLSGLLAPKFPGTRFDDEDDLQQASGTRRSSVLSALSMRRRGDRAR
jgi:N,N-dimethylformamidase